MAIKKNILCFFALAVMVAGQFMLAQHATVHFGDQGHVQSSHSHEGGGGKAPHKRAVDSCQICLSAKVFSHGIAGYQAVVPPVYRFVNLTYTVTGQVYDDRSPASYHPRGPPSLSV